MVKEFTDRFCATGQRQPTGAHAFDRVCTANRSEHRLTKPRTPQTNGMIECFNGRIAEVLATTRFDSAEHFADTIKRYVFGSGCEDYRIIDAESILGKQPRLCRCHASDIGVVSAYIESRLVNTR